MLMPFSTCWPPSYTDINLEADYARVVIETDSNCYRHNNVAILKTVVVYAVANVPNTHQIITCSQFRRSVETAIVAGSGFTASLSV